MRTICAGRARIRDQPITLDADVSARSGSDTSARRCAGIYLALVEPVTGRSRNDAIR